MCIGINCLCKSCANDVDNMWAKANECVQPCTHCEDECFKYAHELHKRIANVRECKNYRITEYHAACNRKKMKIVRKRESYGRD